MRQLWNSGRLHSRYEEERIWWGFDSQQIQSGFLSVSRWLLVFLTFSAPVRSVSLTSVSLLQIGWEVSVKAEHSQQVCRVKDDNGGIFSAAREGRIREGELGFLDLFFFPRQWTCYSGMSRWLSLFLSVGLWWWSWFCLHCKYLDKCLIRRHFFYPIFSFKVLIPMSLPPSLSLSPFSAFVVVLFDSLKEGFFSFRYMVGSLILLNTWVLTLPTVDMKSWSHWIHHQPIISPSSLHHHSHLFSIFTLLVASFFFNISRISLVSSFLCLPSIITP